MRDEYRSKNDDEIDLIYKDAELISKWFDTTAHLIEENVSPESRADMVCVTAMTIGANYSNSIIDLLKLGYHMPAKALLRVLCELDAKLAWCLIAPKNKKQKQLRVVEKKIDQWEKNSLHKRIYIMQEFLSSVSNEVKKELKESIQDSKERMSALPGQRMPKTIEIFNHLPRNWRTVIYPRGFLQFNDAVHIDLATLAERIHKNGSEISVDFDSSESVSELSGYCLSFMYQIILLVRHHFGLETQDMEKDFHRNGHSSNEKLDMDLEI